MTLNVTLLYIYLDEEDKGYLFSLLNVAHLAQSTNVTFYCTSPQ